MSFSINFQKKITLTRTVVSAFSGPNGTSALLYLVWDKTDSEKDSNYMLLAMTSTAYVSYFKLDTDSLSSPGDVVMGTHCSL